MKSSSPIFIKHCPWFFHNQYSCSEVFHTTSVLMSFTPAWLGYFLNLQSCFNAFFFFPFQNENWNPLRFLPPSPPSNPSFLYAAARMWKSLNHKRLDISNRVSLQLTNRTGILAEAIATILKMQNAVLRDDPIQ